MKRSMMLVMILVGLSGGSYAGSAMQQLKTVGISGTAVAPSVVPPKVVPNSALNVSKSLAGTWVFSQSNGLSKGCFLKLIAGNASAGNSVELGSCPEQFEFLAKVTGWEPAGTDLLRFLGQKNTKIMEFKLSADGVVLQQVGPAHDYYLERVNAPQD